MQGRSVPGAWQCRGHNVRGRPTGRPRRGGGPQWAAPTTLHISRPARMNARGAVCVRGVWHDALVCFGLRLRRPLADRHLMPFP